MTVPAVDPRTAAIEKIREGVMDYLAAAGDPGDAHTVTNCFVLFEAQGMEANGTPFTMPSGNIIVEYERYTSALGTAISAAESLTRTLQAVATHSTEE